MFNKKCSRCKSKVSKDFDFCPNCGANLKSAYDNEDYGLLGKNDFVESMEMTNSDVPISKIFATAMREIPTMIKMIEKQMREADQVKHNQNEKPHNDLSIQFFVNGKKVSPQKAVQVKVPVHKITDEQIKRLSKLPKKEPNSKMRRVSGKIVYEIEIPGVKNIADILVSKLENSIEIKAISDDKVYSKILNINLPILGYQLVDENLILELKSK